MDEHFLVNEEIIKVSVDALNLQKKDLVLEIGAGKGAITKVLAKTKNQIVSCEPNREFYTDYLASIIKKNKNLVVESISALEYPWQRFNKIIGNIPFTLSEAIIIKSISYSSIETLVLFIGKTFYEKLTNRETKIGAIALRIFDIEFITDVPAISFEPVPRTDAVLVKLTPKKELPFASKLISSIVTKKGKIKNTLRAALVEQGKTKNQAREIIEKSGISVDVLEKPVIKLTAPVITLIAKIKI